MHRLALLAFLLLPLPALAQLSVISVSDPLRPDRMPLAAATEVPDVLLLGLGGPTALFVNPARAARAGHRFVYGTIRPSEGSAEPISFAGLFGTGDRRWLVTADTRISTQERDDLLLDSRTETSGPVLYEIERATEFSFVNATTRARILLVGRTDFGGYAFGLFGGYRVATDDVIQATTQFVDEQDSDPASTFIRRANDENTRRQHRDDVGVGAEVAFAGRTWDVAAAVSYQRRDTEAGLTEVTSNDVDLTNPIRSLTSRERQSMAFSAEATPQAVDFEVIGALRAGRDREDYLYGSVSGTFGGGTADYASRFSNSLTVVEVVNGEIVRDESSDGSFEDAGTVDLDTRAAYASLGYVYARTERRLSVLAAINPTARYERVDRATTGTTFATKQEAALTRIALGLPILVRFQITRRLEAFGGGVYELVYDRSDVSEQPLYPDDLLDGGQTMVTVRNSTIDVVGADSRLFAGATLTFRSGLTAQAAFRGDLAQFSGWTVSIGYRF